MKKLPLMPWWVVLVAATFCFACGCAYWTWDLPRWIISFAMFSAAILGTLGLHLWNEVPLLAEPDYAYGRCNGRLARRHRRTGCVEFILWKKGDRQGDHVYTENYWCRFDPSWWDQFVPGHSAPTTPCASAAPRESPARSG